MVGTCRPRWCSYFGDAVTGWACASRHSTEVTHGNGVPAYYVILKLVWTEAHWTQNRQQFILSLLNCSPGSIMVTYSSARRLTSCILCSASLWFLFSSLTQAYHQYVDTHFTTTLWTAHEDRTCCIPFKCFQSTAAFMEAVTVGKSRSWLLVALFGKTLIVGCAHWCYNGWALKLVW